MIDSSVVCIVFLIVVIIIIMIIRNTTFSFPEHSLKVVVTRPNPAID